MHTNIVSYRQSPTYNLFLAALKKINKNSLLTDGTITNKLNVSNVSTVVRRMDGQTETLLSPINLDQLLFM